MLPTLIEYLTTLPLLNSGRLLCRPVNASLSILALPSTTVQFQITPGPLYYGILQYATSIACLPDRLILYLSQSNEGIYAALVTEEQMLEPMGHLIFIKRETPMDIRVQNLTAMYQAMSLSFYYLMVQTKHDWDDLTKMVSEYGSTRTNELLGQIAGKIK